MDVVLLYDASMEPFTFLMIDWSSFRKRAVNVVAHHNNCQMNVFTANDAQTYDPILVLCIFETVFRTTSSALN